MTTSRTLMLLAAALSGAALSGCGADVPANPTWVADVHPIMVARCIRCHNAQGTTDPESLPGKPVDGNFDHGSYGDFSDADVIYAKLAGSQVANGMMPPPPAAKLADWQIDTLVRWSQNPM